MEFKRRSKLKTTPNLQILNGGKVAPSHRLPRRHCLRRRGWMAKKICTQKLAITPPPRPRRWQGISHFPLSWGQGDLFPCGVWGSAPRALGENKRRGVRGRAFTTPPRPRRWQGISHSPLSWGQGDLFPCGVWGSAPRALGENKRRGVRGRAFTTPPRPRRWQGIRLFPFHGTKRTCSLAGSGAVPHKPSFASSTACLKNVLFALAPHERVGRKRGGCDF